MVYEQINILGEATTEETKVQIAINLFPYLLPDNFFAINIHMICSPKFILYRKTKTSEQYNAWKDCIMIQYAGKVYGINKQLLEDLKPQNNLWSKPYPLKFYIYFF